MADIEHVIKKPKDKVKRYAGAKKLKDRCKDKKNFTASELEDAVRILAERL